MKKVTKIAVAMILGFTLAFMAAPVCWGSGIILDIGFSPVADSSLSMGLGYRVADWSFLAQKTNFSTFVGLWNFGFFWEKVGYKVGPVIQFEWEATTGTGTVEDPYVSGGLVYKNLIFVIGLKRSFAEGGVLSSSMYAQLGFSTSSEITPEIGFELEFNMLDFEGSLDAVFDDAW